MINKRIIEIAQELNEIAQESGMSISVWAASTGPEYSDIHLVTLKGPRNPEGKYVTLSEKRYMVDGIRVIESICGYVTKHDEGVGM